MAADHSETRIAENASIPGREYEHVIALLVTYSIPPG